MKKILCLFLALIMAFCFCACEPVITETEKEKTTTNKIGDKTISSNGDFEMTLSSAEFVDAVCLDKSKENFLLPISMEEAQKAPEYSLIKSLDQAILSYSFEYSFVGKKEVYEASVMGVPKVKYAGEYEFSQKYFNIVANKSNNMWLLHSSDCYDNALSLMPGLKDLVKVPETYVYQPLSENVYLVRGFIVIPEKTLSEGKTISIEFSDFGQEYVLK